MTIGDGEKCYKARDDVPEARSAKAGKPSAEQFCRGVRHRKYGIIRGVGGQRHEHNDRLAADDGEGSA